MDKINDVEFKKFDKIVRGNPLLVTITEKIDGTNACIVIKNNEIVGVQSRNRFITADDDNYGFAKWVEKNDYDLSDLGDGYHYGEWAGEGIQKNPLKLEGKHFFLFNTSLWTPQALRPKCCDVVPQLYHGNLKHDTVDVLLYALRKMDDKKHEGVVVYNHLLRSYTKHTIENPNGKHNNAS